MYSRKIVGVVGLAIVTMVVVAMAFLHANPAAEFNGTSDGLSKQDEIRLRNVIYEYGVETQASRDGGFPVTQIALRKQIIELHKRNRVGTIRLLLEIVKGGRPRDSIAAACNALALETNPKYPVHTAARSLEWVDKIKPDGSTIRDALVEEIRVLLAEAEKSGKPKNDKKD